MEASWPPCINYRSNKCSRKRQLLLFKNLSGECFVEYTLFENKQFYFSHLGANQEAAKHLGNGVRNCGIIMTALSGKQPTDFLNGLGLS